VSGDLSRECRRKAQACRDAARCASSATSRSEWETLEEEWLRLAGEVEDSDGGFEAGGLHVLPMIDLLRPRKGRARGG